MPGLAPVDMGNLRVAGGAAGGNLLPGVVVNPGAGALPNPNPRLKAPDPLQISVVGDCQVKLTWQDNTTLETSYDILRREPGAALSMAVDVLAADTTQYVDTLPGSGKYEYEVMASQVKAGGAVIDYVVSKPFVIDVPNSPACQSIPDLMRMIFQPVSFNAPGFSEGFVQPILDSTGVPMAFRLPQAQQSGIPLADFGSDKYRIETWLPLSRYGLPVALTLVGNGWQNKQPIDLGSFTVGHTWDQLTTNMGQDVYKGSGSSNNGSFDFQYKFWLEPWLWGAQQAPPSAVLPAPENLTLKITNSGKGHELEWEYKIDVLEKYVSGFNIYPTYSCPGNKNTIGWPIPVERKLPHLPLIKLPGASLLISKTITQMPQGCSCNYQVSAFGQGGESQRADLQNPGDCLTFTQDENVTVTFKDVTSSKAKNAHVHLWANYYNQSTEQKVHLTGKKQNLSGVDFGSAPGVQPGNQPITLGMGKRPAIATWLLPGRYL